MDMTREMIVTSHIISDEDGSLKVKQLDEFADSKAYLDLSKAIAEAKANQQRSRLFAA